MFIAGVAWCVHPSVVAPPAVAETVSVDADRSPVDLVLSADETRLVAVNQTSGTLSLVDVATGVSLDEVACGLRPAAAVFTPDGRTVLATATYSGALRAFTVDGDRLTPSWTLDLGFEPRGVVVSPDGRTAYVALTTAHAVAVVDLEIKMERKRIACGRWPRYLALTSDGKRLAVGASGDRGVAVIDVVAGKKLYLEQFSGINLGHMRMSRDDKYVYFPWMVYRRNPITEGNIKLGWVLASRLARVKMDGPARREAISLDPPGKAVADPHGLAVSPDEQWLACAASGTHELLVYKLDGLPFQDYGGPGDHIDPALAADADRFFRIPLGGRPMAARFAKDGKTVFVANYFTNAVQVVDLTKRAVVRTIALGGSPAPTTLAR
ncbi:MAG: hypothetical protein ACRDD1_14860, partial [Planctomycetia bacterium]